MTEMAFPETISVKNMSDHIGRVFGPGRAIKVGQDRIMMFADATGDHQWIHVDEERARNESPFKQPIAHGFLCLSLVAAEQIDLGLFPEDASGVMNYGLDKVRFLSPVPSGAEVTVTSTLTGVEPQEGGRTIVRVSNVVQVVGADKPAVIADTIGMLFA